MLKLVPVPQVAMVAVPETVGVQEYTRSGEVEPPQLPVWALAPEVVPVTVPPPAAITVGLLQVWADASWAWRPQVVRRRRSGMTRVRPGAFRPERPSFQLHVGVVMQRCEELRDTVARTQRER